MKICKVSNRFVNLFETLQNASNWILKSYQTKAIPESSLKSMKARKCNAIAFRFCNGFLEMTYSLIGFKIEVNETPTSPSIPWMESPWTLSNIRLFSKVSTKSIEIDCNCMHFVNFQGSTSFLSNCRVPEFKTPFTNLRMIVDKTKNRVKDGVLSKEDFGTKKHVDKMQNG